MLQELDCWHWRQLVRLFFAVPGTLSDGISVEQDPHGEGFVVIRPRGVYQLICEHLAAFPLHQFLEIGFVIPAGLVYLIHMIQDKALDDIRS